jgi:molybdopterin molybdotransferase
MTDLTQGAGSHTQAANDHGHADERLVPLEEVQDLVIRRSRRLGLVELAVSEAAGAVLAEDIVVKEPIPPFANTAMDGYAVRSADTIGAPVALKVVGVLPAGSRPPEVPLGTGEAIQIMTGAPMPYGADAIAIVERTERLGESTVRVLEQVAAGANVRPAGSDFAVGSIAVRSGVVLEPAHLGILSSVGRSTVQVWRRPTVGVMSTGDELVEPGLPLEPGQIRDSNRVTLCALVRAAGFPVLDLGTVRDTEAAVKEALARALDACDAVLSSGGVSKGELDFVKVVLDQLAMDAGEGGESFELGVAIRPAKPLAMAWLPRPGASEGDHHAPPVAFFGLPGNPVSAVVSYLVVALPALRAMSGHPAPLPRRLPAVVGEGGLTPSRDGRLNLLRVEIAVAAGDPGSVAGTPGRLVARSAGGQSSHQLSGLASANGLALVPPGDPLEPGAAVEVILFGPLA